MQAHRLPEEVFAIEVISTSGDRIRTAAVRESAARVCSPRKSRNALLGRLDFAVHSSKDMATRLPDGFSSPPSCRAKTPRDAFIGRTAANLMELPHGAIIGSSSLRRQALDPPLRPDIEVVMFRGNVDTRLRKLEQGDVDGTILALAGLKRLGREAAVTDAMALDVFPSAPAQGAICIESRIGDEASTALLAPIHHSATGHALTCERAYLAVLDGSCRTPIAGYASVDGDSRRSTA